MPKSETILIISMCEAGGYVVTRSSCPSALATDANVGYDPPLVLIHHPFQLGLTSGLELLMTGWSDVADLVIQYRIKPSGS
jgi:hypothetical protein